MTPRGRARPDPVRDAAWSVLLRVERDGAYANILLERATADMPPRDAAFCTALTLGVLRRCAQLDWVLDRFLQRPVHTARAELRQVLRLGAYQILHMDMRKAAAVDEAVKLAKAHASANEAKVVNAVLRRVDAADAFAALHALDGTDAAQWSTVTGVPEWYAHMVHRVWPDATGAAVCAAAASVPPLTIRANVARTTAADLRTALRECGIDTVPHPLVPDLLTVRSSAPALVASPPFADGLCHVQDGSSVLAALALDAQPGERIADLCAAPGGKAAVLAAQVGASGAVVAIEKRERRAALVRDLAGREQLPQLSVVVGDATEPVPEAEPESFDRVLVDAPCSALGIARHRPDLLWRAAPDVARDVVPTQRRLLEAGLRLLKPGGVLLYSICTFTAEEGPALLAEITAARGDVEAVPLPPLLARWTRAAGHATIPPGDGGLDGFTILRLRRTN